LGLEGVGLFEGGFDFVVIMAFEVVLAAADFLEEVAVVDAKLFFLGLAG
jgi:hypothetical protein